MGSMSKLETCLFDGCANGIINGKNIRGGVSDKDGEKIWSTFDFIDAVCGREIGDAYDKNIYFNICKNDQSQDVKNLVTQQKCNVLKVPGQGQRNTPAMTIHGLHSLLMILGGRVSEAFKDNTLKILQRYLDGDMSLCKEIEENKMVGKKRSYEKFMTTVLESAQEKMNEELKDIPVTAYIYAFYSDAFPGLLKIGRSQNVNARLSSANTFAAPKPYRVLCMAPTFDAVRDEATTHAHFAKFRREGEFFEVSHAEVKAYFKTAITAWYDHELATHMEHNEGLLMLV